jgi:hypothetical protein
MATGDPGAVADGDRRNIRDADLALRGIIPRIGQRRGIYTAVGRAPTRFAPAICAASTGGTLAVLVGWRRLDDEPNRPRPLQFLHSRSREKTPWQRGCAGRQRRVAAR